MSILDSESSFVLRYAEIGRDSLVSLDVDADPLDGAAYAEGVGFPHVGRHFLGVLYRGTVVCSGWRGVRGGIYRCVAMLSCEGMFIWEWLGLAIGRGEAGELLGSVVVASGAVLCVGPSARQS